MFSIRSPNQIKDDTETKKKWESKEEGRVGDYGIRIDYEFGFWHFEIWEFVVEVKIGIIGGMERKEVGKNCCLGIWVHCISRGDDD